MVLLKPGTPHDYGVEPELQRWELLWSHFVPRAHWLEWLDWPELATGLMHLHIPAGPLRRRLSRCFHEADRLVGAAPAQRHKFAMHALEEVILLCDQVNPRTCEAHLDDRVREAMEFMGQNLKRKVSLEEIADAAGLSVSRLSWLFRKHAAASPMQYMEAQRLDRAQRLLELTNLSVKEISRRVGFDSPFYFSLRFKRHTGLSPRTYRLGKGDLSKGALPDHDQKRI